jgi:hypothetical protein
MKTTQAFMSCIYRIHDALRVFTKHNSCVSQPNLLTITLK